MQNKQFINLDLTTIHFPLPAIVSILHRISGVVLFFATPIILWLFDSSLDGGAGFGAMLSFVSHPLGVLVLIGYAAALAFHIAAGIKHLVMDWAFETKGGARVMALMSIATALVIFMVLVAPLLTV